jgi:hypothetical protein
MIRSIGRMGNSHLCIALAMREYISFFTSSSELVTDFVNSTGYGAHGDYLFGWKEGALQRGMDALGKGCGSEDCTSALKIQAGKDAIACTKSQQAKENVGSDTCKFDPFRYRVSQLIVTQGLKSFLAACRSHTRNQVDRHGVRLEVHIWHGDLSITDCISVKRRL